MKKLIILVFLSIVLTGCSQNVTLYPQSYEAALSVCENNEGLEAFEAEKNPVNPDRLYVLCGDGARYELAFKRTMTSYKGDDGNTYERWETYSDHTWEIEK